MVITHDQQIAARFPRREEVLDGQLVTSLDQSLPAESMRRVVTATLRPIDVMRVGVGSLGARAARTVLTALGIAIGIAALVSVVGISASSRADLLAQLDKLRHQPARGSRRQQRVR